MRGYSSLANITPHSALRRASRRLAIAAALLDASAVARQRLAVGRNFSERLSITLSEEVQDGDEVIFGEEKNKDEHVHGQCEIFVQRESL
ncbi:hypothetical protein EVAR_60897_1 [Eumeta japonica]|uniref:Uncharacterized protein n=1 Tax=Eumeta variegata TaxID=151549 RepID=A0A4C1YK20_EUMVA|nr:hypothetical protein EVAR_60897_1 [Eumeta japonica]